MKKVWLGIVFSLLLSTAAFAAALLPPGKQQFLGNDGAPLTGGSVFFYIPGTTTPKDTYQDPAATILNTNPVQLDSGGFAVIYGTGAYRQIVKDATGQTIYDQLTADTSSSASSWAGLSTGSANALNLVAQAFSAQDGQIIFWKNQFTNTGPTTVTIAGNVFGVVKDTLAGPVPLSGGELTAGNISAALYDTALGQLHLIIRNEVAPTVSIAATLTTDLGTARSNNINITGSAIISSFGASAKTAAPLYFLTFAGNAVLTHNATSLILPGGVNITTVANSFAVAKYLGAGNWQVLSYFAGLGAGTEQVNAQTGTSYTLLGSDQGKLLTFSNTSPVTVTLPQAIAPFSAGFWIDVQNVNTGLVTLVPTIGTIDGAASLILPSGYGLRIVSDGTNWIIKGFSPLKGRVLLNTIVATNVASISDLTSFTSLFTYYDIEYINVIPVSNNQPLQLQVRASGVFQTTTYLSNLFGVTGGGTGANNFLTYIPLSSGTASAGSGVSGTMKVYNPSQTTSRKHWWGNFEEEATIAPPVAAFGGGYWNGGNAAITGFQVFFSSGNISSGVFRVYGYN